jgi:hypothetical protein
VRDSDICCVQLSSLSHPHCWHSCHSVCPSLYRWTLRVVWSVNSITAVLSLNLLIAKSLLALPSRGYHTVSSYYKSVYNFKQCTENSSILNGSSHSLHNISYDT